MKKILILIALLFMTCIFADTSKNTSDLNTKEKQVQKPEKCKDKKYCKQMSSCSEAKFYLEVCGYTKLDKDGDGIPCESLCK